MDRLDRKIESQTTTKASVQFNANLAKFKEKDSWYGLNGVMNLRSKNRTGTHPSLCIFKAGLESKCSL